jgi:hypothetical protein
VTHTKIIPADLDKRFRWAIVEYAKNVAELPTSLTSELEKLLETDVRPEALDESKAEIKDLDQVIERASKVTMALAYFFGLKTKNRTGELEFIKWLGASGWGNDIRLIRLFDDWYAEAQRRKVQRKLRKLNA